jgi:hypothetical protein
VTLALQNNLAFDSATDTVSLHRDNGSGLQGGILLPLGMITIPAATRPMHYTFPSPSAFPLQTGMTYWIEVGGSPIATVPRTTSTTTNGPGTLGNSAFSRDGTNFTPETNRLLLEVDSPAAVAALEPSSLTLMVLEMLGVAGYARRRSRACRAAPLARTCSAV